MADWIPSDLYRPRQATPLDSASSWNPICRDRTRDGPARAERILRVSVVALLLSFVGLACESMPSDPTGTGGDSSASVSLVVEPESADVSVGDTVQLEARVVDDGGQEVSGVDFAWSVSDPEVASVDDTGELVGLAQGNVDVTVEATLSSGGDESLTGQASVAVLPGTAASLAISPSSPSVQLGDTLQLVATVTDEDGEPVERTVEWSSSDTQVASVDADGRLVGRAEGEASISARASSVADTAGVSVELTPAASIEISPSPVTLGEGATTQLEAIVRDSSGNEMDRSVSWSSSNTSVATVDPLGQVQAQVEGEAVITARSGDAEGTSQVTVEAASSAPAMPSSLSLSESSRTDTSVEYEADWSGSSGASSYSWSAGSNSGNWSDSGSGLTDTQASFTAPRGDADDSSFFCVAAVNSAGSSESRCTGLTVPAQSGGGGDPSEPPSAPSSLSVSATSSSRISGSFTDNADNESGFEVQRNDGSGWVLAAELGANDTNFADTGLAPQTAYSYRVRAVNSAGVSNFTSEVSTTTLDEGASGSGDYPHEPAGLTRIFEHDFSSIPVAGSGWVDASHDGVLNVSEDEGLALVSDPSAIKSPSGVLNVIYRQGLGDGSGGSWMTNFWDDSRNNSQIGINLEEMYVHLWIKFEGDGTDWDPQGTGSKIPFYFAQGSTIRRNHSPALTDGGGSPQTQVGIEWYIYEMEDDGSDAGGGSVGHGRNVLDKKLQVGEWYELEFYMKMNTRDGDPGQSNGIARWWVSDPGGGNLELVGEYTNIRWGSATNSWGFYNVRLDPIWGGDAGEAKSQEDHWYMDHLYISGIENTGTVTSQ